MQGHYQCHLCSTIKLLASSSIDQGNHWFVNLMPVEMLIPGTNKKYLFFKKWSVWFYLFHFCQYSKWGEIMAYYKMCKYLCTVSDTYILE